ncbi:MAG TPA: glycosyltransferase family 2 protein [Candidatus Acidoferrum sp.]|nr:glycosyltransferase family 2 protein [Candidatus Acidoferrum sp.]
MAEANRKPRVSVGMPLYNCERYVADAIDSHLRQTYSDFELVITDNASTDRSEEICRSYADRDPRIKYYRNPENIGAGGNFRRCFELAQGEYFRWTPSDDVVGPELLELCVEVLDRDPSVLLAYPQTRLIDSDGRIIEDYDENLHLVQERPSTRFIEVMHRLRLCNVQYGLTRRKVLGRTGLMRNYPGGDIPLILELSLYGKFYEVPEHLFYRRMHEGASSAMKDDKDVMVLFDPKKRDNFFARNWVHLGANLKSIARAPIPIREKLKIVGFQARSLIWSRRDYLRELAEAVTYTARKIIQR